MNKLSIRSQTAARILKFLALNGPANRYAIRESGETATQPTVITAIKELQRAGVIAYSRKKSPRSGKVSKHYDLSPLGLFYLISHYSESGLTVKDLARFFDGLAVKYKALLPGIFELWPEIMRVGLEDLASERLRIYAQDRFEATRFGFRMHEDLEETRQLFLDRYGAHYKIPVGEKGIEKEALEAMEIADRTWDERIRNSRLLWEETARATIRGVQNHVTQANAYLRSMPEEELKLVPAEEILNLKLAIRMLQDASGLKVTFGDKNKTKSQKI